VGVVSEDATNEFPRGVTFSISLRADPPPKEVRVQYHLAPDGTGASAVADCSEGATITCTHTLTSGAGIFIIPGANITWHWEVTDASGQRTNTPDKLYVHQDTRFTFQTLQQGDITLYYHSGSEAQARAVLQAAAETLDRIGQLEQTQVNFPVKVFLYETADEMQPAIAPGGVGRGVQVLGEVVYSDTAMVSADVATLDITRHEVAHIVTRQATKGPFDVPGWLNEGISVYAQSRPLAGHAEALQSAIDRDRVLSMRELNSSASGSTASTVGLYYGQAGSIVKYLVDTYGAEKFAQLLRTFKAGSTVDKAFQTVYGFDSLGLENEWRASVGLGPRSASPTLTPAPTEQARAAPTSSARQPSGAGAADGGTSWVLVGVIAGLVAAVVVAAAAFVVLLRQRL